MPKIGEDAKYNPSFPHWLALTAVVMQHAYYNKVKAPFLGPEKCYQELDLFTKNFF